MRALRHSHFIVQKPSELTVKWAERVIRSQLTDEYRGISIRSVECISVDIGTTTRVRLAVDHDGSDNIPKRWFVKLPSLSFRARAITALPRLLATEVRFYNEIARFVPVDKPLALTAQSQFSKGSTLVLNDVSETGAIPGNVHDELTVEQAYLVIEQLAQFHAHFMSKVKTDPRFSWLAGPTRRLEDRLGMALAVPLMKRGIQLAGDRVMSKLHTPALSYARYRKRIMKFLSKGELTLVHHDCHPGNLFWNQGKPGFLDWQMVRLGEEISDVSYFLATGLVPEIRRKHELGLLTRYHEIMAKNCPNTGSIDELLRRYRAHLIYPFEAMVITLAVGGMMHFESNLKMIHRVALAIEDHDTFTLLPLIA